MGVGLMDITYQNIPHFKAGQVLPRCFVFVCCEADQFNLTLFMTPSKYIL